MSKFRRISEEWVSREDEMCRKDRLRRLDWLVEQIPNTEHLLFPGGLISKYLYEEARYCFVYGQFLASIVLGFAFIEHTLAALLYAAGRNDFERSNISRLLQEALNCDWINQVEFQSLDKARRFRNPVTHYRRPLHDDTIMHRAVKDNELQYTLIEEDARHVMRTVMNLLNKQMV